MRWQYVISNMEYLHIRMHINKLWTQRCLVENIKELHIWGSVCYKTAKNCARVSVCYKTASLSSKREQAHRVPNMHAPCPEPLLCTMHYAHYYALCTTAMHTNMYPLLPCIATSTVCMGVSIYACSYRSTLLWTTTGHGFPMCIALFSARVKPIDWVTL